MTRVAKTALAILFGLLVAASGIWASLALMYSAPGSETVRLGLAVVLGTITLATLGALWSRWRGRMLSVYIIVFTAVLIHFYALEPSNQRDWQLDVAVLPHATIEGPLVTMHNIRNFEYRTETDFTPAYYDRVFDLRALEGVDLVAVYWMGPAIAHIFVSFAFAGGNHLAVSIETRKEKGEGYSTLRGFFRQYELYYVVGDERDVIRLRTNFRQDPPEDVYVYRLKGPIENGHRLLLEYVRQINALASQAKFYNTLTTNCTTVIWTNTAINADRLPFSWRILASGYVPKYLYDSGRLDSSVSFRELQLRAHVNARAHAADTAPNFSRLIRTESGGVMDSSSK